MTVSCRVDGPVVDAGRAGRRGCGAHLGVAGAEERPGAGGAGRPDDPVLRGDRAAGPAGSDEGPDGAVWAEARGAGRGDQAAANDGSITFGDPGAVADA